MEEILKRTLITGANGMVGGYFDFGIKLDHAALDITDPVRVEKAFEKYSPKVVIHLAAATDVDRCEREPEYAYSVNAIGTWNVASAAKKIGAKVIYVSTVYVFDGKKKGPYVESDMPSAPNYYGRSKQFGEAITKGSLEDHLIVRAGWMIGGGPAKDKKFIAKIVQQLDKDEIKAVADMMGSVTYAKDLAAKIKELILKPSGAKIIHVFNDGFCSRYDIAAEIVKIMGSRARVVPVDSSYFNLDASRSHSDIMDSRFGGKMRPWREALKDYLTHEWTSR
jgi:dTDP-4-dehydrorhamnose reductase